MKQAGHEGRCGTFPMYPTNCVDRRAVSIGSALTREPRTSARRSRVNGEHRLDGHGWGSEPSLAARTSRQLYSTRDAPTLEHRAQ